VAAVVLLPVLAVVLTVVLAVVLVVVVLVVVVVVVVVALEVRHRVLLGVWVVPAAEENPAAAAASGRSSTPYTCA
jgi:hypothetical protein